MVEGAALGSDDLSGVGWALGDGDGTAECIGVGSSVGPPVGGELGLLLPVTEGSADAVAEGSELAVTDGS